MIDTEFFDIFLVTFVDLVFVLSIVESFLSVEISKFSSELCLDKTEVSFSGNLTSSFSYMYESCFNILMLNRYICNLDSFQNNSLCKIIVTPYFAN